MFELIILKYNIKLYIKIFNIIINMFYNDIYIKTLHL